MAKTKHQQYVIETVLRSEIKEHPQNPRIITDSAKKKLRDKMKDVGLLQPLIINKTTGYLLGGHQRLATLDSLEKWKPGCGKDYSLDVAVVALDAKRELEMLVFLNNPGGMGKWDENVLADIALIGGIDFKDMGFDAVDTEIMFDGDSRFEKLFDDSAPVSETKDALQSIKEERKAASGRQKEAQSIDYYVTVVCQDKDEKEALMKHLGIPKGEIYISPAEIMALKR